MIDRLQIASAFIETLWVQRSGSTRTDFRRWQSKKLKRWLERDLPLVDFYRDRPRQLQSLPIIDKSVMMANFAAFNRGRITAAQGWRAYETTGRYDGVSIGASTGTSGNRTLYAVTRAERNRWVGVMLAKTAPRFLLQPERVAVVLPQNSALYDAAKTASRLTLAFYDLREPVDVWLKNLEAFAPTTIIAPPRMLRHLTEIPTSLSPRRIYSAAETLDTVDQAAIEAHFGIALGQIYMATEGLFAVSCRHGRLHLAEDANYFEFEPAADGLVAPVVTGFRRRFQIIARYRMNDLLRLSQSPCACGSPLQAVDEIVGRMDDAFLFERSGQAPVLITPDILRNAVLEASRAISDFRVIRRDRETIALFLRPSLDDGHARAASEALRRLFHARGLTPKIEVQRDALEFDPTRKLRRVENLYRAEASS